MVTIIKKYTGGAYPYYEYACLSTDVKPVSLVPENSICHEIDTGKHYYLANGEWHQLPARGGEGGGLPADFPAEGSENANKFLGFDANGDYTAKDAPSGSGGAEKFVVTLTLENDTWTADKTIAEIVAADAANKVVVAVRKEHEPIGFDVYIPLNATISGEFSGVSFCGVADTDVTKYLVSAFGMDQGSDVWQVTTTPIPTSSNAPLVVTLTAGETEGQYVGDKTYKEVYDAFISGKTCLFNITISDSSAAESFVLIGAAFVEGEYTLHGGDVSPHGVANDYVTFDFGS